METGRGRSVRGLLLLAGAALLVALLMVPAYPRLVSAGLAGGAATTVRAIGIAAFALAPILALTALVRRIVGRP